eukprot:Blabericola_migrator_1__5947@NODE_2_length_32877_cov_165_790003_g1_i0_p2_GENE_NODE_2_length_32877_cov_165_790003_g1_i0NODE_2_length_32877_cov_165_790003_g1_i0_p2_ORF_typecomplete_len939_score86_05ANAPC4_WD40/PF12894_7/0_0001ANAPC4_WD40/PF12894_7/0_37ANAPC4_WD40/PF12894_7/6_5e08ANAPC4_WD40/PF12894_7/1_6ANAPC4_WD40/PF12894_7/6_1e02WD40/PF00400_32/8e03WD40/PF00400_32/1_1e06WD40/PF00400_32/0_00014WD40/PF00400_32/4_8e02WD40/PF00400_32/0_0069WD40/PF00400_32/45Ge1_WD40/PF16529_5/0_09Ge1_WD40/PF16529_5/
MVGDDLITTPAIMKKAERTTSGSNNGFQTLAVCRSAYQSVPSAYAEDSSVDDLSRGYKSPRLSEGTASVPNEFYDAEEDRFETFSSGRRRRSLFPEDPFSDGAAATESIKASQGRAPSNNLSLSSPDVDSERSVQSQILDPSPMCQSPLMAERELSHIMSSPVTAVANCKSCGSATSSPLAPLHSSAVCVSDSPLATGTNEDLGEDALPSPSVLQWPIQEELSLGDLPEVAGKHTRLAACDFDERDEVVDPSQFMDAAGELGSTDMSALDTEPSFVYPPLIISRHRLEPLRMETVFEEHEEATSLAERGPTTSSSSSSSNFSIENDRLKFEDMLGIRAEKIRAETAEKSGSIPTRPTSESQQTEGVHEERSSHWTSRLKGRFAKRLTTSSRNRRGTASDHEGGNSRRGRRGSGTVFFEKLMRRDSEMSSSQRRSRAEVAEPDAVASPNVRYTQKNWQYIPVKSRQDHNDKTPRVSGFESVWLLDKDEITVGIKEWVNTPVCRVGPDRPPYLSQTPAGSPHIPIMKVSRRGRGTQTPMPQLSDLHSVSGGPIWCMALSRDGRYLAAGSRKGYVYIWELLPISKCTADARCLRRRGGFAGHTGGIISLQWSACPKSYVLISCAVDKTVRIWTLECDTTLAILRCSSLPVGISFTKTDADDQTVVASLDGSVKLVNLTPPPSTFNGQHSNGPPPLVNCEAIASYNFPEAITCLSISPDGRFLACGMQFGSLTIQSLESGVLEKQIECRHRRGKHRGEKITGIDWSQTQNGDFICATGRDSRIRVICLANETDQLKLKGADIRLKAFFDPSSRFVIGVSEINRVSIWDLYEAGHGCPVRRHPHLRLGGKRHPQQSPRDRAVASSQSGLSSDWIPSSRSDGKRASAPHVSSFKIPDSGITALLVSDVPRSEDCEDERLSRAALIMCGTSAGSLHLFVAVLTPP